MKKKLLPVAFMLLAIMSCSKDDENDLEPNKPIPALILGKWFLQTDNICERNNSITFYESGSTVGGIFQYYGSKCVGGSSRSIWGKSGSDYWYGATNRIVKISKDGTTLTTSDGRKWKKTKLTTK